MWKLRIFNQENAYKMDKLLHFLKKNKQNYTFHADRNKEGENYFKVFWLETN